MKETARRLALILFFAAFVVAAMPAVAQSGGMKTVQGKVLGIHDVALPGAIVYLENVQTSAIRSFFSTNDGAYRFGQVAPANDYRVWALYKDRKSSTHTISSYDSRTEVYILLRIKTPK